MQIEKKYLCFEDYMMISMLPIFGEAIGKYSGQFEHPVTLASVGMLAVAKWWCSHRGPGCGEPDLVDAAAQVAEFVARQVGFETDVINVAKQNIKRQLATFPCANPTPDGTRLTGLRVRR